ncbi:MAG: diphosphomevalonate decarboxylase [Legionellales bacterium RIFCSPHIGHO2_12_FULL_42_9]|nr:MAG: diphosphomevalonate decarboxylase [Legionellales bacterium RIFCSPHIGHO2_12_FULL_42_9]
MQWFSQAPANIALIKYMGKKNTENNTPDNPSLSYTLNKLQSSVMLESQAGKSDLWEPLLIPGAQPFDLNIAAQQRFLKHLAFLKSKFNYSGGFIVRSSNNFPHSSGLASSASSFAALTKCAVQALSELTKKPLPCLEEQAHLSQLGSGSSCRSFFSPWALWDENKVGAIDLPYPQLDHHVIIISHNEKQVSSALAHLRVKTSPLYATRSQRARENLKILLHAFESQDWQDAFTITWREFHDMHTLFATSTDPFSYITPQSKELLNLLQDFWHHHGDGPLVTMDAGPNIHLLYRLDQLDLAEQFRNDHLIGNYDVL